MKHVNFRISVIMALVLISSMAHSQTKAALKQLVIQTAQINEFTQEITQKALSTEGFEDFDPECIVAGVKSELINAMLESYQKNISAKEAKRFLKFFQSPLGKKTRLVLDGVLSTADISNEMKAAVKKANVPISKIYQSKKQVLAKIPLLAVKALTACEALSFSSKE